MEIINVKKWKYIEKSRNTLIDDTQKKLTIIEVYDCHGDIIDENITEYNNVHLKYDRVVSDVGFEGNMMEWEKDEVYIDNNRVKCIDVYDIKGNKDRATIRVVIGQG